jgi:hypothetical protein
MNPKNEIFIVMDDSGKLNSNESSCIFGGLFFYSSTDYMNFINKYKSVINSIKCKYCKKNADNCDKECIEIKGNSKIKTKHKRQIFNLVKTENNYGVFIRNDKIYDFIMNNKESRGRYCDYAQKRIVKEIVLYSITNKFIDPNKKVNLYIKIDESKTKRNGYYNLKESIYEELVNGIINYDYSKVHKPILKELNIKVKQYNSKYNFGIQSADIMSNYLHREFKQYISNNKDISFTTSFIEVKLFLP